MDDTGVYLYAVAGGHGRDVRLDGVAGAPVRTVGCAGLVAYVSTVPLDRFGEEPLRRALEDLDWLGDTARAHHGVVEAVAEAAPAAPVRLVTVYRDEEQVRDLLRRRRADFLAVLSHVTGRREWGVKAYVEPVPDPAASRDEGDGGQAGRPGTAYLKRRQANLRGRAEARGRIAARAERIHAALRAVAVESRLHRAQDPMLSGRDDWMVLNGAYLVDETRGAEFRAALRPLGGEGMEVQLTGPWAPYSFTALELDAAGGGR